MASHKTASAFLTISLLLLLLISHSSSSDDGHQFKEDSIDNSQKVKLSLYYEALCPYCADFITNNVSKIFENGLISIIDLRLLPWGNAYVKDDKNWVCQVCLCFLIFFSPIFSHKYTQRYSLSTDNISFLGFFVNALAYKLHYMCLRKSRMFKF